MKEKLTKDGETIVHEMEDEATGQKIAINLSASQLENLMLKAITAARQPDQETERKAAEEKQRREEAMANMVKEGQQGDASRLMSWERCDHRKPDHSSRVHGQIHSDGLIHPICLWCQKLFAPYPAPRELMTGSGF